MFSFNKILSQLLLFTIVLASSSTATAKEEFQEIQLDQFIKEQTGLVDGGVPIKMAIPISFKAAIKQKPQEKDLQYVYTALTISAITPMPEVNHRMFIETPKGKIFPVYVEKNAAAKIDYGMKEGQWADFQGYHLFNYSKGPAIMVIDYNEAEKP